MKQLVINGYHWRLGESQSAVELEKILRCFPDLATLPGVETLKSNLIRTVYLVPGEHLTPGSSGCVAKVYRYSGRWDRLRYRFIAARAKQEWRALNRFQELGLPVPAPLAVAEEREGKTVTGGGLLMSFLPRTVSLLRRFQHLCMSPDGQGVGADPLPDLARDLLVRVGKLVREMHDRGIWHRDLHAGNILVGEDNTLHLIDLHSCLFLPRLARWQRRGGVAKLSSSLLPQGVDLFLEAYGANLLSVRGTLSASSNAIGRVVGAIQRKHVKSRCKRCFLPSSRFAVSRARGMRLYHLRERTSEALSALWVDEPTGRVLKQTSRGWVQEVRVGGDRLCVKYRRYDFLESLQSLIESHRLRRSYGAGHALWVNKISTPKVIALRERTLLGMVREAHLVTEYVDDGVPLHEYLFQRYWGKPTDSLHARRKHLLARAVGRFVRTLHDANLYPHDLSPQNLLVSPEKISFMETAPGFDLRQGSAGGTEKPCLFLIDLEHLYLWQPLWRQGRRRNLVEIANLPEGHVTAADLLRGLKAYARDDDTYLSRAWIHSLREGLLEEHWSTLNRMENSGLTKGATQPEGKPAGQDPGAVG